MNSDLHGSLGFLEYTCSFLYLKTVFYCNYEGPYYGVEGVQMWCGFRGSRAIERLGCMSSGILGV